MLRVGQEFEGRLEKLKHNCWTGDVDIWRVYFMNSEPVEYVDAAIEEIELISDDTSIY